MPGFIDLSLGSLHMQKLERVVVIMYSKGCGLHPLLYIITTNPSSFCMWRDPRLKHDGALVSASSVSVSPGVFCQDAQAVFFPHPRKCDVVSHPVMAWKSGNATDREGPRKSLHL